TGEIFQESGARLRTRDYSYSETGKISIDNSTTSGVKYLITFDPAPTAFGEYMLSINGGTFTLDGAFASPDIEQTFTLVKGSDVTAVYADENGCVTVMTLDGKVILDKTPAEKLRALENGIYIVNGKKTLLK
ncbi:MAG: hypothetical protein K2K97_06975, partial [Muribaculaceae bacterium]|nr:hypothetical protein [Muribaculaceae bacterium]